MKKSLLVLSLLASFSCIPLRIAPQIEDYKLTNGKRFKRGLPKKTTFVFEDPKEANEFYDYINTKFQLDDYYVAVEVPFRIDDETYFFSFYEVEIQNKALNLGPVFVDVLLNEALGNDDFEPVISNTINTVSRTGNWYIAMEVFSKEEKDCLDKDAQNRTKVLTYLRALKEEYLSTTNYNEVVFKN